MTRDLFINLKGIQVNAVESEQGAEGGAVETTPVPPAEPVKVGLHHSRGVFESGEAVTTVPGLYGDLFADLDAFGSETLKEGNYAVPEGLNVGQLGDSTAQLQDDLGMAGEADMVAVDTMSVENAYLELVENIIS